MGWPAQLLLLHQLNQTLSPGVGENCAVWKAIEGATGSVDWRSGLHATRTHKNREKKAEKNPQNRAHVGRGLYTPRKCVS